MARFSLTEVNGNAVRLDTTKTVGILASYRYMLTPHSALEANYGFGQNSTKFVISSLPNGRIHTRNQEFSAGLCLQPELPELQPFP